MPVEWTLTARRATFRIFLWIAQENPHAARAVYEAIFATADGLERFAERHRDRGGGRRRIPVDGFPNYYIRYRVAERGGRRVVVIETVRHGAMDRVPT